MAEILKDDYKWNTARRGAPGKYPWKEWMDGQVRKIVQGEDFTCKVVSMQTTLWLKTRGGKQNGHISVRTSVTDDGTAIVFQYFDKTDDNG